LLFIDYHKTIIINELKKETVLFLCSFYFRHCNIYGYGNVSFMIF